jgi:hypothetical protein
MVTPNRLRLTPVALLPSSDSGREGSLNDGSFNTYA